MPIVGKERMLIAIQHTFITWSAESRGHPARAQSLERHSRVDLTLSRYTHMLPESESEAVECLTNVVASAEVFVITGTDGKVLPAGGERVLAFCLAKRGAQEGNARHIGDSVYFGARDVCAGGRHRIRTCDLYNVSVALCQLS